MNESVMEEKIISDLLAKGNKQVVDWIQKLEAEDLYVLLTRNLTYKTILDLIEIFKKDFESENQERYY